MLHEIFYVPTATLICVMIALSLFCGIPGPESEHDTMFRTMGFCIARRPSSLPYAGTGVFVTRGCVPEGDTVSMYPGAVDIRTTV